MIQNRDAGASSFNLASFIACSHPLHPFAPRTPPQAWHPQEEHLLVEGHMQFGNRWSEISRLLPGRTENGLKNHVRGRGVLRMVGWPPLWAEA